MIAAKLCANPDRVGCLGPPVVGSLFCRRCMIEIAAKRRPAKPPLAPVEPFVPATPPEATDAPLEYPRETVAAIRETASLPRRPYRRAQTPALPPRTTGAAPTYLEMILAAALTLRAGWTLPDLAVAAWKCWPATFTLGSHPHPDSNRVASKLYGATGLIGRGLVDQLGDGRFALTAGGRARARLIDAGLAKLPSDGGRRD